METAGEGGAWGIALLAAFMQEKKRKKQLDAVSGGSRCFKTARFPFESRRGRCRRLPKLYGALYERAFDRTRSSGKHVMKNTIRCLVSYKEKSKYFTNLLVFDTILRLGKKYR